MKVAIIGASGKTGIKLVQQSLERGYQTVTVCRHSSIEKLQKFTSYDGFTLMSAPVVSAEETLTKALDGCEAVLAVLITVGRLKATELVVSLTKATAASGIKRLVFTAGEVTAAHEEGEAFTLRQRFLKVLGMLISWITPYSMTDMVKASVLIRQQPGWNWTIVRAPTLRETPSTGYTFGEISDVTSAHSLSREDYAACLLDSLETPKHHRRILTVLPVSQGCPSG